MHRDFAKNSRAQGTFKTVGIQFIWKRNEGRDEGGTV